MNTEQGPPRILLDRRSPEDDGWRTAYELPLMPVVQWALGGKVPHDRDVDVSMRFLKRADEEEAREDARMVNLREEIGWVEISVDRDGEELYRSPHTLRGLLGPALLKIADALEEGQHWGFRVLHGDRDRPLVFRSAATSNDQPKRSFDIHALPGAERRPVEERRRQQQVTLLVDLEGLARIVERMQAKRRSEIRPTPEVKNSVVVDLDRRRVPFTIRKEAEPEAPLVDAAEEGLKPDELTRVNVVLSAEVFELLTNGMELSGRVEEGGYLAGEVFRLEGDRHLVRVHRVLQAEHTGASIVHFTFTSDSFQAVHRSLRADDPTDRLIGWWHTHPRGLSVGMGLSETDVELHHSTFGKPWQVAGLINLGVRTDDGPVRFVRFYAAADDRMERCALWIPDERGGYRVAPDVVGE